MSKFAEKMNPRLMKAAIYGANDGIITTFAVMAGVIGASLSTNIVIILGLANLFADGISMGLGDFIGERSERRLRAATQKAEVEGKTWETGLVTFIAFVVAGFSPILPFILNQVFMLNMNQVVISLVSTGTILFLIGSLRTLFTGGKWWKNGLEMFAVGMFAAAVAYLLGSIASDLIPNTVIEG